jgi:hypothetical protein
MRSGGKRSDGQFEAFAPERANRLVLRETITMTDNELIALFAGKLEAGVAAAGWDYAVIQNNQPTQEGIPTAPIVLFEKLFDHEYGWQNSTDYQLQAAPPPGYQLPDFRHTESQWVESTFQVTSLVIQDVRDLSLPTPSDVAHAMKLFLNAKSTIYAFRAAGAMVLRVTDIRNPKFTDERGMFEANPSFDVVLQHKRSVEFSVPGCDTVIGEVEGVA